jgi:hypothetical protein
MKCTQRLYLTTDRKKVVGDGDKKAASLYAVPGDEIPQSAHDAFGLVDGHLKGFDPSSAPKAKEPEQPSPTTVIATQALYHSSAAADSLVGEDDPAADRLYANVGDEIPLTAHEGFGLVDGHLPGFDPNANVDDGEGEKEDKGASDKEDKGSSDKEDKGSSDKEDKGAPTRNRGPAPTRPKAARARLDRAGTRPDPCRCSTGSRSARGATSPMPSCRR